MLRKVSYLLTVSPEIVYLLVNPLSKIKQSHGIIADDELNFRPECLKSYTRNGNLDFRSEYLKRYTRDDYLDLGRVSKELQKNWKLQKVLLELKSLCDWEIDKHAIVIVWKKNERSTAINELWLIYSSSIILSVIKNSVEGEVTWIMSYFAMEAVIIGSVFPCCYRGNRKLGAVDFSQLLVVNKV